MIKTKKPLILIYCGAYLNYIGNRESYRGYKSYDSDMADTYFSRSVIFEDLYIDMKNKRELWLSYTSQEIRERIIHFLRGAAYDNNLFATFYPVSSYYFIVNDNKLAKLKTILQKGVPIDLVLGDSGETALMIAAEKGYLAMVKFLTQKGASLSKTNRNGQNALKIAQSKKKTSVMNYLKEKQKK